MAAGRHLGFSSNASSSGTVWGNCVKFYVYIASYCKYQLSHKPFLSFWTNSTWRSATILDFLLMPPDGGRPPYWICSGSQQMVCEIVDTYNRKLCIKVDAIISNGSWTGNIRRKSKMAASRHVEMRKTFAKKGGHWNWATMGVHRNFCRGEQIFLGGANVSILTQNDSILTKYLTKWPNPGGRKCAPPPDAHVGN